MSELSKVSLRVPQEVKLWVISHCANNPDLFYSPSEVWLVAMREYMQKEGYAC